MRAFDSFLTVIQFQFQTNMQTKSSSLPFHFQAVRPFYKALELIQLMYVMQFDEINHQSRLSLGKVSQVGRVNIIHH